jgi:K(+)-stimulated pyrophosphate-energized sodium pump
MSSTLWLIIGCGILSIVYAVWAIQSVMAADAGNARMQEIAGAIREGATAYLTRQYTTIAIVGAVVFVAAWLLLGAAAAIGFLVGAVLSGAAGFIGMLVSVRANVRTAQAASKSLAGGLDIAFKSGAITGLLVAGLALLGVAVYFFVLVGPMGYGPTDRVVIDALVALGFGASLISIFARLGGGIFTKGADVGGDLVGKVEAGIPEDDPRNPATIADNVGDNVGDCAGMAADLFETYAVTIVATMVLASIFFTGEAATTLMLFPLLIGASCVVTSIIGTFFVKLGPTTPSWARSTRASSQPPFCRLARSPQLCGAGLAVTRLHHQAAPRSPAVTCSTVRHHWPGGYRPDHLGDRILHRHRLPPGALIAQASVTGHGTNVIQGLAVSLEATAIPALIIIAGIITTYALAGLFGIAIA